MSDSLQPHGPGSSVHGFLQARILEWVAISFSRGSSQSKVRTPVSYTCRQLLYHWAIWEAHNGLLLSLKKEGDSDMCYSMCEAWGCFAKSDPKGHTRHDSTFMSYLEIGVYEQSPQQYWCGSPWTKILNISAPSKALCISWIQGVTVLPWRTVDTTSNHLLPRTDMCILIYASVSCSVVSSFRVPVDCSPPGSTVRGILQARTLECVGHSLLQGLFSIQGSNLGLPDCRWILYLLSHQGSPEVMCVSRSFLSYSLHINICLRSFSA